MFSLKIYLIFILNYKLFVTANFKIQKESTKFVFKVRGQDLINAKANEANELLFKKLATQVSKIAFDKNANEKLILLQILQIHDEILNFYEANSKVEQSLIKLIFKMLDKAISIRYNSVRKKMNRTTKYTSKLKISMK
jgi:hypothetical protein